jgi:hypothetical protein
MTSAAIVLGLAIPALIDALTRIGRAMHIDRKGRRAPSFRAGIRVQAPKALSTLRA